MDEDINTTPAMAHSGLFVAKKRETPSTLNISTIICQCLVDLSGTSCASQANYCLEVYFEYLLPTYEMVQKPDLC